MKVHTSAFAASVQWLVVGKALLLCALVLVAYIPAMRADFNWDDGDFLTQNKLIKAPDGLYRFWFTTEPPDYFPLTSSVLWIEWRLWGMNPMGYHVVNVLLHLGSCLVLWRVLKRLSVPGAWLVALVYAVHPVNVESVAWITERKNTLPMFLALISVILFLRAYANREAFSRTDYLLSILVFVLALLSKTSVALFPVVLLGCLWWNNRRIARKDIVRTIPFFVVALVLSLVTIWFQYNRAIGDDVVRTDAFASRLAGAGWAVWFYLYKALIPINLSFVYPRWEINANSPVAFIPAFLLIVLGYVFWRKREGWGRPFVFAMGYYVVTLFPILGFFNIYFMRYSLVADHWQYTSLVGVVALVVGGGVSQALRTPEAFRRVAESFAAVLVLCLSLLTWRHNHIFTNEGTLWRDTIAKNPKATIAYGNLGFWLMDQGYPEQAIPLLQKALEFHPNDPDVTNNLALALGRSQVFGEAERFFQRALELKPDFPDVHSNMGNMYARQGNHTRAIECFQKALDISSEHAQAHYGIALSLSFRGEYEEAEGHFLNALALDPSFAEAHNNLGALYQETGDLHRAIRCFQEALRHNPSYSSARFNLANALMMAQTKGDARRALEIGEQLRLYREGKTSGKLAW